MSDNGYLPSYTSTAAHYNWVKFDKKRSLREDMFKGLNGKADRQLRT